jgi:uncharacterized phage-associated protein
MASATDVARYLIHLAHSGEEPDPLTPLRLQKLMYYVQGWCLGAIGRPLFAERIEAWTLGPVVRDVYHRFKSYERQGIPTEEGGVPGSLTPAQRAFIESVWEGYKVHSASALCDMTHRELPWLDARGGLPPDAWSDAEITHDAMRAFFKPQADARLIPGIPPERAYRALEAFERGEGRPRAEVFARLRNRS